MFKYKRCYSKRKILKDPSREDVFKEKTQILFNRVRLERSPGEMAFRFHPDEIDEATNK